MVLAVRNLSVTYETRNGTVHAVEDVSFTVEDGHNYGLSGESGSGKSTVAEAILGLLPDSARIDSGVIEFKGRELGDLSPEARRDVRWEEIAYIPQSAMDALDPVMTTGDQIVQAIRTNRNVSKARARERAADLFEIVGLDPERIGEYPHQFSGGMRQRVVIAMALALEPDLIIADEPTTGLDVIVQDKIMDQILDIQERIDSSLLFITHDIGVIAETCEEFSLLYGGKIMEQGSVDNVLLHPTNPYTMGLKNAFPEVDGRDRRPISIPGSPPDLDGPATSCRFLDRCPFATAECRESHPDLRTLPARNQRSACHHVRQAERMRREAADPETWGVERESSSVTTSGEPLLETENLTKEYTKSPSLLGRLLGKDPDRVRAARDVSLSVSRSEILGIAGESGSGKSTLAETIALLDEPTSGTIFFDGRPHEYYRAGNMSSFRQKVQIVFQDPFDALNPRMTVRQLVAEPLSIHGLHASDRGQTVRESLRRVGLVPAEYFEKYPHQLSGGERQRVAIARALVLDPELLICDEPASMLDVSLKASLLNVLGRLVDERDLGVLYISHDLASLTQIADRLAIMYLGEVVEQGPTDEIIGQPKHPYTEALLSASPEIDPAADRDRVLLDGASPDHVDVPEGCSFESQCPRAVEKCSRVDPRQTAAGDERVVACHFPVDGPPPTGDPDAEPDALPNYAELLVETNGLADTDGPGTDVATDGDGGRGTIDHGTGDATDAGGDDYGPGSGTNEDTSEGSRD